MCDYSLAENASRLAINGEQLLVHRFASGSMGLKSAHRRLREILFPSAVIAVCIPCGARVLFHDIPDHIQRQLGVGEAEPVEFIQHSLEAYTHRDGVRFANGREMSLQRFEPGQRVTVLTLEADSTIGSTMETRASSHAAVCGQ
jgi:hypothetical protein